ncbi:MAG TPA: low molecular weight protein-tyrosine-phosphatase [Polyangiaceae bacterium]|nr:low molecular weight protein-tyrosine-phosphatase [Polyangiaceae bacterium]
MVRLCFVCLGNICRSPTAEAVMRGLVERAGLSDSIEIDSAGTGDWHVGEPPDPRSVAAGKRRGIVLGGRARHFEPEDWARFDYVLALDEKNYRDLAASAPRGETPEKLRLLRSFDPTSPPGAGVPDPYYTTDGFDEVIDLCVAACEHLLAHVRTTHGI